MSPPPPTPAEPDPDPGSGPAVTTPPVMAAPAMATPVMAIAVLAVTAMAIGASMRLPDALLPRLAAEFHTTLGQAAQVITAFSVAYGLSQLLFGPLGDRYGKYRVIGWAAMASAATALLCALAPGHATLLAARLLAGASAGAVIPLAMAWIGDVVPYEQRQTVLARFLLGQMGGVAIGVWAGGFTAEHLPWRTPFAAIALFFAGSAALLQLARRRLPAAALATRPAAAGGSGAAGALRGLAGEFGAVLSTRWARLVLLTVFAEGAAFFGAFAFVAVHLHQRLGLPLSTVGAMVMGFALGGMGFALGARWLVRWLGEAQLVLGGAGVAGLSLLTLAAAPGSSAALAACTAMGLGFYMMHNTLQTQATQMAPQRRGAAVAAFAGSFFLGQSAGVALGDSGRAYVEANFDRSRPDTIPDKV